MEFIEVEGIEALVKDLEWRLAETASTIDRLTAEVESLRFNIEVLNLDLDTFTAFKEAYSDDDWDVKIKDTEETMNEMTEQLSITEDVINIHEKALKRGKEIVTKFDGSKYE